MTDLLDPQAAPYRGIFADVHPTAIPRGGFQMANNLRYDGGAVRSRNGFSPLVAAPTSSLAGTFRGGCIVNYGGPVYLIAQEVSSEVRILKSSGGAWSELSNAKGGDKWSVIEKTRMAVPSDLCTFQPVGDDAGLRYVVVQNGTDRPRLIDLEDDEVRIMSELDPPSRYEQVYPYANIDVIADMSTGATHPADSGDHLSVANVASGGGQAWRFTTSTATTSANAGAYADAIIDGSGSIDLSGSDRLTFIVEASDPSFYDSAEIMLISGLNQREPTDYSNPFTLPIRAETSKSGTFVLQFDLAAERFTTGGVTLSNVNGIRLVARNGLAAGEFTVYLFGGCGAVPGGAQYAVAWRQPESKTESPGVLLREARTKSATPYLSGNVSGDGLLSNRGGQTGSAAWGNSAVPAGVQLPMVDTLGYSVQIGLQSKKDPAAGTNDGALYTHLAIYRSDAVGEPYLHVDDVEIMNYSAGWQTNDTDYFAATNDWEEEAETHYQDRARGADRDFTRSYPSAFSKNLPIGLAMAQASERLYVAGGEGALANAEKDSLLYASEVRDPWRYRVIGPSAPEDAVVTAWSARFSGQNIRAVVPISTSAIGADNIYVLTDKAIHQVYSDGLVSTMAEIGCLAPHSVALRRQRLYWLAEGGEVWALGSELARISRNRVESLLTGTDLDKARGVFFGERYALAFDPDELGADRALIFNEDEGVWESLDTVTDIDIGAFQRHEGEPYAFASDGQVFEAWKDGQHTDDGELLDVVLVTPRYSALPGANVKLSRPSVSASARQNEAMTAQIDSYTPDATGVAMIDLGGSGKENWVWKAFQELSGNAPGAVGMLVEMRLVTHTDYDFRLWNLSAQLDGLRGGPKAAR